MDINSRTKKKSQSDGILASDLCSDHETGGIITCVEILRDRNSCHQRYALQNPLLGTCLKIGAFSSVVCNYRPERFINGGP